MPQVVPFIAGVFGATAPAVGTAAFGAYVAGAGVASWVSTSLVGKLLSSVALSALSAALAPKPTGRPPGIRTDHTMTGGTTPASFVLGRYATEGQLVAPPMSQGKSGETPNAFLTYVIELGDIPGQSLEQIFIDGAPVTLDATPHAEYGFPALGKYRGSSKDYAWFKYYDGTQTAADPMLIDKFGDDPDRPWSASFVGAGLNYVICTFRLQRKLYSGFPRVRFVMGGVPLYDPRRDTSVGGSGDHRWTNSATWQPSENPAVQIYNILRGIPLPGGAVWGGDMGQADLPLSDWFAAMTAADTPVALSGGGTEPAFRAGYEVFVSDEPASVIEELLKACAGQIAEAGGVWKMRVGGPGLPVWFLSDEDVNIRDSQQFEPFPSLGATYNGIHASYPDPDALWQSTDAPPRYNADYEAADGDRRLVADLDLPAVPYAGQVQRLMRAYIEEERRMRRHVLTLAPGAIQLEPLDTLSWTSLRNGYTVKAFEVSALIDPLVLSTPRLSLRERDAGDHAWHTSYELPVQVPSLTTQVPEPYTLESWSVSGMSVGDSAGAARRPALSITWDSAGYDDISGILYEVRVAATGAGVTAGICGDFEAGGIVVTAGIIANVTYEARIRPIPGAGFDADWTYWAIATAPALEDGSRAIDLHASTAFVRYDATGASPTPGSVTLTAVPRGTVGTPWYEFLVDGVSQQTGPSDSYAYTPPATVSGLPQTLRVTLREDSGTGAILAVDHLDIHGAAATSDALIALLSNPAHATPCNADGTSPIMTGSGTRITVYQGVTPLSYDGLGTGEGTYRVLATAFNGTITPGAIIEDAGDAVVAPHSGFGSDVAVLRYTVTGRASGATVTLLLDQSLSKALAGVAGPAGAAGETGATGAAGPTGAAGAPGATGADGSDGLSTYQAIIFRRAASTPSTPSGGNYNFGNGVLTTPAGWYDYIPGGSSPVYACRFLFAIDGNTGTDTAGSWSLPKLVLQNGVDGADGTNGTDGANGIDGSPGDAVAVVYAFKESASAPATPSGGQFAFSGPTLTPPAGWSAQPPSATQRVWVIQTVATTSTPGGTNTSLTWSTPRAWSGLDGSDGTAGSDGADGSDGKSTYQAAIYKRVVGAPAAPSGGSFDFGTNTLTPPSGWSVAVPTGSDPVHVSRYLFVISGDTGIDSAGPWSTPALLAQNGANGSDGADGISTYLYPIYRRSGTIPSTPTGGSYDFGANAGTPPTNWLNAPPGGSEPLYVATALAAVSGTTGSDTSLVWSAPSIISGPQGATGATGATGAPGSAGAAGARGPGRWHVSVTTLPASSSAANTAFVGASHTPASPIENDQAWFYTGALASPTGQRVWIYTSGAWQEQTEVVDGNLFVSGTVTAGKLSLNGIMFENDGGQLKIRALGIDTTELNDDAVSVFAAATGTSKSGTGGYQSAASVTVTFGAVSDVLVLWSFEQSYPDGIGPEWGVRVKRGTAVLSNRTGMQAMADYPTGVVSDAAVAGGTHTYALDWHASNNAAGADISAIGSLVVLARQK
jgi:hypothetical protein